MERVMLLLWKVEQEAYFFFLEIYLEKVMILFWFDEQEGVCWEFENYRNVFKKMDNGEGQVDCIVWVI